jgi:hypothetical protein
VPEIKLPVDQENWDKSTSKFPSAGKHLIEVVDCGIETEEKKSVRFNVEIYGDEDEGKTDKLVGGGMPGKTFKTKETLNALKVPYKFVKGQLIFNTDDVIGKKAIGLWIMKPGHKGGDPMAEKVEYAKLEAILPAGAEIE